jgi:hypothetical protein
VGRLQTAHGTRVRHRRDARLEAGRVRCMRHARARLEKATVLRCSASRALVGVPS